jgi:DNA invertase Pin-like site-specific DNA recombinase
MRAALYARYSSDQQREASIADQQRICREFAARQGWTVVADFTDAAKSGASLMRTGIQALMLAAADRAFDVVVAESLDRLSRDQEDTAGLFKRLAFADVRIVTISEGDISQLHVGFKGTMNALYLSDLRDKTRRGLRGRVEAGKSAGGVCFGYRVVRALEGEPRGDREVDSAEAAVVQRIFSAFVAHISPETIAKTLNAEGIPGPMGVAWSPSTIHGHARRGTGILNNELYIGRLVWNRQRYVKDPDTGKRLARLNPPEAWIISDVPHLRIIDESLWQAVKSRQSSTRNTVKAGIVRARRPKYLFSGLTRCGTCGGGFILASHDLLTCFNARSRGTCSNHRSIKRQEVEGRALRAMKELFFEPGAFASFCEGFTAEMNLRRREHVAQMAGARREIVTIDRELRKLVQAIKNGVSGLTLKDEFAALEARKAELTASLAEPPAPALHPQMAEVYRQKATTLAAGLEHDEHRDAARQALRGFLEKIVIPSGDGLLQVVGNVGSMLAAAQGRALKTGTGGYVGCGGPQPPGFGGVVDGGVRAHLPSCSL